MRRLLTAALCLAIALMAAATAAGHETTRGTLRTLPGGEALGLHIEGFAQLKLTGDGAVIRAEVRGLVPGKTYAAHLHKAACSDNQGDGHYKNDPNGPSKPPNELWLSSTDDPLAGITADEHGAAYGRGTADWVPKSNNLSVVIHDIPPGGTTAGGTKIACADLPVHRSHHDDGSGDWQGGGNN
jgi:hypothetical protein